MPGGPRVLKEVVRTVSLSGNAFLGHQRTRHVQLTHGPLFFLTEAAQIGHELIHLPRNQDAAKRRHDLREAARRPTVADYRLVVTGVFRRRLIAFVEMRKRLWPNETRDRLRRPSPFEP